MRFSQVVIGFLDELEALVAAKGGPSPVLTEAFLMRMAGNGIVGIQVVGFLGTFIYLLLRAGYIG